MNPTSVSLLDRLKTARPDASDWNRLQGISKTWQAFQRFGVDGEPAGRVAEELGMTENSVILAKARVLKRLREEAGDLLV